MMPHKTDISYLSNSNQKITNKEFHHSNYKITPGIIYVQISLPMESNLPT